MGTLRAIYLRPSARTPVKSAPRAEAVAGRGLEGDHAGGGKRQVTLLDVAAWEAARAELGRPELDPGARRANLLIEGVPLHEAIGRRLRIGAVELEVVGETAPCGLMDDVALGLRDALVPARRGGVFARILTGGPLAAGDEVELLDPNH